MCLCLLTLGFAATSLADRTSSATIKTAYDIYWKGIRVFTIKSETELLEDSYSHESHMRSRGVLALFLKTNMNLEARGINSSDGIAQAEFYRSYSIWNKNIYEREVHFGPDGFASKVMVNIPDDNDEEGYREEVAAEFQISPDPLSLFIGLMKNHHNIISRKSKSTTLSSFDGSRSMKYVSNCSFPEDNLKYTRKSDFKGQAHYCEIKLKQTGGFWHGDEDETDKARNEDEEQKPLKVWFGKTEGGFLLPVKMEFKSGRGTLKIYLKDLNRKFLSIDTSQDVEEE
ncbi:MAG: DUF3108 domain-containing protein [Sphingomonadales bacterium]|jgi:hypothetical protein